MAQSTDRLHHFLCISCTSVYTNGAGARGGVIMENPTSCTKNYLDEIRLSKLRTISKRKGLPGGQRILTGLRPIAGPFGRSSCNSLPDPFLNIRHPLAECYTCQQNLLLFILAMIFDIHITDSGMYYDVIFIPQQKPKKERSFESIVNKELLIFILLSKHHASAA